MKEIYIESSNRGGASLALCEITEMVGLVDPLLTNNVKMYPMF